jgi:hypothetical protein
MGWKTNLHHKFKIYFLSFIQVKGHFHTFFLRDWCVNFKIKCDENLFLEININEDSKDWIIRWTINEWLSITFEIYYRF